MPFSRRLAILENEISGDILFKTRFLIILEKLVAEPASDQLSGILSSIEHAVSLCVCSGWLWSRPQCSAIVTAILANAEHYFGISTDFYDDNQKLKMTNRILTDKLNLFRQLETDVDRDKYLKQCSLDPRNLQLSEECIGQGGFSKVFIASYNGGPVAVKKIDTSDKIQVEIAKREAFMLQKLYPILGLIFQENSISVVMNLATSCLFRAMRNISVNPISWQKKLKIFRDLSAGVAFIHAAGIVHGDMKPSNVLLDSSFNCKIADFGGSRNNTSLRVDKKIVITLQYVPKETIKNGLVGPPMDVFAVGRIIWELSCDGRIVDINDAADVLDFIPSGIEEIVKYACDEDWKTRANALQLIDSLISFEIDYSTLTIQSFGDSKVIVTNNDKEEYEASIDQSQKQLSQAMSLSTELNFENVDPITRSQAKHSLSRSTKSSSSFTNYRSSPRDESKFSLNRKVTNLSVERLKRSVSVKSGPFANSVNSSFDPTESPSTFWARYIEDTCSISQFVDRIRFIYPTFLASEIAMKSLSDPHVLGTVTLASFESFVALYSESINDQISSAFSKFCMSSCHPTSQELSQTKIWNEISRRGSALKDGLITDSDDINAMHCAARNGFADIVELMLFVDSVFTFKISTWFCFQLNKRGFNACHIAVLCNKLDCVRLFLDSGLVDEKTSDGSTALSLAISSGSVDVVKMILKAGANVNIKDDSGVTPALVAAFGTNITILRLITENPTAKIDIKNKKGLFPLHSAVTRCDLEAIKIFAETNVNMNLRTASGYTSLHLAVKSGYIECIKLLLSLGANVNLCIEAENLNGATALFLAVKTNQSIDIINLLIAEGADVDMVDSEHVSPFQIASFCGNVDASKALMEAGAIITVEDVRVSELRGHLELVKMVRKSRGKPTNGEYPAKKCGKGLFARFF